MVIHSAVLDAILRTLGVFHSDTLTEEDALGRVDHPEDAIGYTEVEQCRAASDGRPVVSLRARITDALAVVKVPRAVQTEHVTARGHPDGNTGAIQHNPRGCRGLSKQDLVVGSCGPI